MRNARAQERLISDLLDMSRVISGKLTLTMARISLEDVIEASLEVVRPAAVTKGIEISKEIERQLPELMADGAPLQQIFWNLLANAVRHTRRGGRITVRVDQLDHGVRIRIEDTGEGIPPEHLLVWHTRHQTLGHKLNDTAPTAAESCDAVTSVECSTTTIEMPILAHSQSSSEGSPDTHARRIVEAELHPLARNLRAARSLDSLAR